MKTGIKVSDTMSQNPVMIDTESTAKECAKIMIDRKVGSIIVKKAEKIVGIVTEKDIIRLIAKDKDVSKLKVGQIMTSPVKAISPDMDLYDAMVKMKKEKVRRLPVIVGKKVVGMLTMNDILKMQPYLCDFIEEKYHAIMVKKPNEEYIEGQCDMCDNYGQLYRFGDQLLCEECRDEEK